MLSLRNLIMMCMIVITALSLSVKGQHNCVSTDSICADFDLFIEYLTATHPNVYSGYGGQPFFYRDVIACRKGLLRDSVTSVETLSERIAQMLIPLHDGHTLIYSSQNNNDTTRWLPMTFMLVEDGMVVSSLFEKYKKFVGYKVIRMGNCDIDVIKQRFETFFATENKAGAMKQLCNWGRSEKYLRRAHVIDQGADSVTLTLQSPTGKNHGITLPLLGLSDWYKISRAQIPASLNLPNENFAYTFIGDKKKMTAYLRINKVYSRDNFLFMKKNGWDYLGQLQFVYGNKKMPEDVDQAINNLPVVAEVVRNMLLEMKEKKVKDLIIDLRGNNGGWTPIVFPMLYLLYGEKMFVQKDEAQYIQRLSPLYLRKINKTLDQFNAQYEADFKLGDYIFSNNNENADVPIETYINNMMCASPEILYNQQGKPLYRPQNIVVITNENTFSAAFHTTFYLRRMGAVVMGVTSSQAPNTYMESTPFKLPRTQLQGSISNSMQLFLPPTDKRAREYTPDVVTDYNVFCKYKFDKDAVVFQAIDFLSKKNKTKKVR